MANRKTFVRVFDDIDDHPGFMAVSTEGLGLWVKSLTYCNRNLTDGHFPQRAIVKWHDSETDSPAQLTEAGRWHLPGHQCEACPQPAKGFAYVHGYLEVNRSREQVQDLSAKRAETGSLGGRARAAKQSAKPPASNTKQSGGESYPDTDTDTDTDNTQASELAESFATFWAAYPNHKARKPAEASWAKATRKAEASTIMAGLTAVVAEWRADRDFPRYVPMASTWLNQERWTDEAPTLIATEAPTVRVTARQCLQQYPHPRHEWISGQQPHMCLGVSD